MQLQDRINRERLNYITASYALEGNDRDAFQVYLCELLQRYAQGWVELALIEVLVQHWHLPPLPRGVAFLEEVQRLLRQWAQGDRCSTVNELQFQCITGLVPLVVSQVQVEICER
jgi:hypothetical protein